jgi:hypothetical protein
METLHGLLPAEPPLGGKSAEFPGRDGARHPGKKPHHAARMLRQHVITQDQRVLLVLDYSGVDLRILL